MIVVADTGPLLAAANRRDAAHGIAAALVSRLGRQLVVPEPVIVEVDYLLRARVGRRSARLVLESLAVGEHAVGYATPALMRRAIELDRRYDELDLGFCDAFVMAYAERHDAPVLTFDFAHFRATRPQRGHWRLVVDEARYRESVGR